MPENTYTHGHAESVLRSHRWRTAANSAAYLLPHLSPGQSLLDVGCGPGTITAELASLVAPGRCVGVDSAADVVAAATEATRHAGTAIEWAVGDAYTLDHRDDTFDVVHAHQVLQHLSDPVAALREWRRVTKPGGIVAARDADYHAMIWYPTDPRLDRWMELYQWGARANQGEPDAGRRLGAWAHAAGFSDVTTTASVWRFTSDDDRAWWGGMWADRIVSSALPRQLLAAGRTTTDELRDIADAFRSWSEHPDGFFTIVHGEVIARA
jgi:ubiquinone/menaquinone biosynthesis C-methylase UbiE